LCLDADHERRFADRDGVDVRMPAIAFAAPDV
jgi:hypothetical protein